MLGVIGAPFVRELSHLIVQRTLLFRVGVLRGRPEKQQHIIVSAIARYQPPRVCGCDNQVD
jgi:hypothetical protein